VAFDTRHDEALAEAMGFSYLDLDALLEVADVVTLHVPSTPKTHHLIDWERFQRMKRGAVLINTARGDLVDTRALVRALAEGRLAGAGLDVLAEEPTVREEAELMRSVYERTHNLSDLLADHVLLRLRNVVVTPHSAFDTREARRRIVETTIDNVRAFAAGAPENVVG
jgi:D-lactate dehydrogenase